MIITISSCSFLFFLVAFSVFLPKEKAVSISLIPTVCLAAFCEHVIDIYGIIAVFLFCFIAFIYFKKDFQNKIFSYFFLFVFISMVYHFIMHEMPGFYNPIVLDHVRISQFSSYFSMNINFDKVLCALLIFLTNDCIKLTPFISVNQLKHIAKTSVTCILFMLTPVICSGYVKFDPKIPDITLLWMMNNFLFVCFSEEIIFRGYIQDRIHKLVNNNPLFSILIASCIFGLYHINHGIILAVFSAICGLFYGYIFYKTNNVWCSILVHFSLNFCHFILFTYPNFNL